MCLSLEVPSLIFNVYQHRRFCANSLTCINVIIFVGEGKMNVNPCFSLQVPPPIC